MASSRVHLLERPGGRNSLQFLFPSPSGADWRCWPGWFALFSLDPRFLRQTGLLSAFLRLDGVAAACGIMLAICADRPLFLCSPPFPANFILRRRFVRGFDRSHPPRRAFGCSSRVGIFAPLMVAMSFQYPVGHSVVLLWRTRRHAGDTCHVSIPRRAFGCSSHSV